MAKIAVKKKGKMYECQAFFPSGYPKKWKYVTNLESFAQFLSKAHSSWKYFNVYEKGTRQYLKRFYPGGVVPRVLSIILVFFLAFNTPMKTPLVKTTSSTSINGFNYCATIPTPEAVKKEGVLC